MTWADDFYAGTYGTLTTGVDAAPQYYDRRFLDYVKTAVRLIPLGQSRPLPEGNGKTINWERFLKLAASVSAATLTEGAFPNATAFNIQELSKTIGEYGSFVQASTLLRTTMIDQRGKGITDILADQASTILDRLCGSELVANGSYPVRADLDATKRFSGVVDSATATTLVDAVLITNTDYGDANDDLNQSIVIITSGTSYGQARAATDYVQASGTITVSPAWDITPVAGDTFVVVSTDALTVGDDLSYENIKRAVANLRYYGAMPGADGYFVGVADAYVLEQLMDDTKWINVNTYKDQPDGIFAGEIGKFAGVRWVSHMNQFAYPITTIGTAGSSYGPGATGANYSITGGAVGVPIIGQNAYGVTNFSKDGKVDQPIIQMMDSKQLGQPIPRFHTAGWMVPAAYKGLNPLFAQTIHCYNASLAA